MIQREVSIRVIQGDGVIGELQWSGDRDVFWYKTEAAIVKSEISGGVVKGQPGRVGHKWCCYRDGEQSFAQPKSASRPDCYRLTVVRGEPVPQLDSYDTPGVLETGTEGKGEGVVLKLQGRCDLQAETAF